MGKSGEFATRGSYTAGPFLGGHKKNINTRVRSRHLDKVLYRKLTKSTSVIHIMRMRDQFYIL